MRPKAVIEKEQKPKFDTRSIWVNAEKFDEFKKEVKLHGGTLAEEFNGFITQRLGEYKGTGSAAESSMETGRRLKELKDAHFQSGQKVDKLMAVLQEKKVYDKYMKKFGEALNYEPSGSSWEMNECVDVIVKFLEHSSDEDWKRAETRFLVSCKGEGNAHLFLDYAESCRERRRLERKLLEIRCDSAELERLDRLELQEEEQKKRRAELQKQREDEEARRRKEQEERELNETLDEAAIEEEKEEEDEGFTVVHAESPDERLNRIIEEEQKESDEQTEEEEDPVVAPGLPALLKAGSREIVPVSSKE